MTPTKKTKKTSARKAKVSPSPQLLLERIINRIDCLDTFVARRAERQQREIDNLHLALTALEDSAGPKWKTNNGTVLRMRDMTDSHIDNSILYLKDTARPFGHDREQKLKELIAEQSRRRFVPKTCVHSELAKEKKRQFRESNILTTMRLVMFQWDMIRMTLSMDDRSKMDKMLIQLDKLIRPTK